MFQTCTEGSNLSLRQQVCTAEKFPGSFQRIRESWSVFEILPQQTGLQRTECSAKNGVTNTAFSEKHTQSSVSVFHCTVRGSGLVGYSLRPGYLRSVPTTSQRLYQTHGV